MAKGVSDDGRVLVGFASTFDAVEAYRWTPETGMVGLGDWPGERDEGFATDVSGDGSVVVGYGHGDDGQRSFRWTEADGLRDLGSPPASPAEGVQSKAYGISTDGRVIVGQTFGAIPTSAFRWTEEGGMQALGHLPGGRESSLALATSADGSIVVGEAFVEGFYPRNWRAFIWDAQRGMTDLGLLLEDSLGLDLTGWTLVGATDISDDGTVTVGHGINPAGQVEGWVAVIPEPIGVGIGAFAILLLMRRRPGQGL